MTTTYVLMQNLKRNPLRTTLTALSFALPMAIFVAAISVVVMLVELGHEAEKELRLGVHHRATLTNLLPAGMRSRIEELDPAGRRLRAVCGMRWFGGRVPDTQNTLTSLAADADTFPVVYPDVEMTPSEIADWQRDRRACIAGGAMARRYGWTVGGKVTLESTIPPYLPLEFRVVKIMTSPGKDNFFYFRADYLDEAMAARGEDGYHRHLFWVKCASADALASLQNEIDRLFANSPNETKSEDENAFAANFTKAAGDIPGLMQVIAIVVVVTIAMIAGNTMMMSLRERTRELGVFKAIGFQNARIFYIVLAESVLLAVLGALLGVVPTALWLWKWPPTGLNMGPISVLHVQPAAVVGALAIALVVGVMAGLWPAYQALRLRTVDALRKIA